MGDSAFDAHGANEAGIPLLAVTYGFGFRSRAAVYYLFIQLYGTDLFGIPTLFNKNNYATWILPVVSLALGNIAYYAMWLRRGGHHAKLFIQLSAGFADAF